MSLKYSKVQRPAFDGTPSQNPYTGNWLAQPQQSYSLSQNHSPQRTTVYPEVAARWKCVLAALTARNYDRVSSKSNNLPILLTSLPEVKGSVLQCFFCGKLGHSYRDNNSCSLFNRKHNRTGAHYNNWCKLINNQTYSLDVLYPQQYCLPQIHSAVLKEPRQCVQASVVSLDLESIRLLDNKSSIPTEYTFNGWATDTVSNNLLLLTDYKPLPRPIPVITAAEDSNVFIIGKGRICIVSEDRRKLWLMSFIIA